MAEKPEEAAPSGEPSLMVPLPISTDRQAIGCILPLSGRFADEGKKALDAALLAADIFKERSPSPWKIAVADGGGAPGKGDLGRRRQFEPAEERMAGSAHLPAGIICLLKKPLHGGSRHYHRRETPISAPSSPL